MKQIDSDLQSLYNFEKLRSKVLLELKESILKGNETEIKDDFFTDVKHLVEFSEFFKDVIRYSNHFRRVYGEKTNEFMIKDLEDFEDKILKVLYYISPTR